MVLPQETIVVTDPASNVLKSTILSAFTFLSALSLRDLLIKTLEAMVSEPTQKKLVFVYFYASCVILITMLLAYIWQNSISK